MKLTLTRTSSDADSTLGVLSIGADAECVTVEDEYRVVKVKHETRIPAGTYSIVFRTMGGFHEKHLAKYGASWHRGMLWLHNVPGFEYILIHAGNSDDDSSGCILVGTRAVPNGKGGGTVTASRAAYEKLYPKVRDAILRGEAVTITVVDQDRKP